MDGGLIVEIQVIIYPLRFTSEVVIVLVVRGGIAFLLNQLSKIIKRIIQLTNCQSIGKVLFEKGL